MCLKIKLELFTLLLTSLHMNKYINLSGVDLIELLDARDIEIEILSSSCSRLISENYNLKERLEKFEGTDSLFDYPSEETDNKKNFFNIKLEDLKNW